MSNLATINNNLLADSGIDDLNVVVTTGSYSNPAWITALAWTKITGAPANIVTGTGTTNFIPKFTSSSAIGNSAISDDGSTVNIASRTFQVTTGKSMLYNVAIGGTPTGVYATYADSVIGIGNLHLGATSGAVYINTEFALPTYINPLGGNVGIGTLSVGSYRLTVNGDIGFVSGASLKWGTNTYIYGFNNTQIEAVVNGNYGFYINSSGQMGVGTSTIDSRLVSNYGTLTTFNGSDIRTTTALLLTASDPGTTSNSHAVSLAFRPIVNRGAVATLTVFNDSVNKEGSTIITFNSGGGGYPSSTTEKLRIWGDGQTRLSRYGSGLFTGTAAYNLAVDSSGNIIEITGATGSVTGTGTTNYIPKWTGTSAIGNSTIYDDGTNVGIGGISVGSRLSVYSGAGLSGRVFEAYYGSGANQPFNIGINRSSGNAWIGWNAYQSTGDTQVYQLGNTASRISAGSGFLFQVAASGTANSTISWTDAASISTAGNLTTNSWAKFYNVNVGGAASGTYAAYADSVIGNGNLHLVTTSGAVFINSAIALPTYINPVGGSVGINTTSPGVFTLNVNGTIRGISTFSTYVNDGLFSANARPTTIEMPNGSLLVLGYYSAGNGIYYGRIGWSTATEKVSFGAAATNTFRVGVGIGDTQMFTVDPTGIVSSGSASATDFTATKADAITYSARSGAAGSYTFISIGRTSSELELGVAGAANQFFTGTVAGDAVIKVPPSTGKLFIGATSGSPAIVITQTNNVGVGNISPDRKFYVADSSNSQNTFLAYNQGATFTGTVIEAITDRTANSAFNLMNLKSSTTSMFLVRGDGNLFINGTTGPTLPIIDITASGTGTFMRGVRMLNSGMLATNALMYAVGRSDNARNMGQFYFYYAGDGSNSNRISMGLHSVDDKFNIFGTGNISINTTSDLGVALGVAGSIQSLGGNVASTNGTVNNELSHSGSGGLVGTTTNHALLIRTAATTAINIDTSQNAAFTRNISLNNTNALYFTTLADENWKMYRSTAPAFTRAIITTASVNINVAANSQEGFAIGTNGGNSAYEIKSAADSLAFQHYFRGIAGIGTNPNTSYTLTVGGGFSSTTADFTGAVTITTGTSPGLNIVKNASTDNRYLRLTNTQASSKNWDLINQTNANSNRFVIYNATDNINALQVDISGRTTINDGLKINSVESTLYAQDGALAYYSSTNAVYLNGAGPSGWLRLNAAGTENDRNSINIFGSTASSPDQMNFRTGNGTRLTITNNQASFNGNVSAGTTVNWNSGIGALSYGTGFITMETNSANAIQFKTNGSTAQTINTNQTIQFASKIAVPNGTGILFNSLGDENWKIYRTNSTPDFTRSLITLASLNINAHYGGEGFAIGANGGSSYYEILGSSGTSPQHFFRGRAGIGDLPSTAVTLNTGTIRFTCGFSTYTTDGLFSASAEPSWYDTPGASKRVRFGYNDYGGGQYYGAIGFDGPTQFSIGHRYSSNGNFFGIGTGYRGEGVILSANNNVLLPQKLSIGSFDSNDAGINLRGYGVADATTTFGFLLNRGTKIGWTDGGNGSTGEYIYSQQGSPYSVTIHSGAYNAIACPNTSHVYINHEAGTCSIGSTSFSTSYKLYVTGSTYSSGGFFEASDIRLKDIVNTHEGFNFGAIEFKWIDGRDDKLHWGYAAQEVLQWIPDAVINQEDGHLSLDYNQVHTYKIAMLEKRIAELEQQLKNK